jgi:hypothetical protein
MFSKQSPFNLSAIYMSIDVYEYRQSRKMNLLFGLDQSLIISYLNTPFLLRSDSMLNYLKTILLRIRFPSDLPSEILEDALKECSMHLYHVYLAKSTLIPSHESLLYILIKGEVVIRNKTTQCTLTEGSYFGALIDSFLNLHKGSVICTQPCHFACITSTLFSSILDRFSAPALEETSKLLKQIPNFKHWGHRKLNFLSRMLILLKYERHRAIFEEGESCDYIYIIMLGEVEITKQVPIPSLKSLHLTRTGRPISLPDMRNNKFFQMHYSIKGELQVIGDQEALIGSKWPYTCKCYSMSCELYRIACSDYLKLVDRENTHTEACFSKTVTENRLKRSLEIISKSNKRVKSMPTDEKLKDKVKKEIERLGPWKVFNSPPVTSRMSLHSPQKKTNSLVSTRVHTRKQSILP